MFTEADREALLAELLERARADRRVTACAITGSGSIGRLDRWSDIDLAFGIGEAAELPSTVADFTAFMAGTGDLADTLDVVREPWIYRVFLLSSTLQVDLAFVPASAFGARAATFRLVFGEAVELPPGPSPVPGELVGYGWLYALHARSSIARRRLWQAEHMIGAMRDTVLALACLRHDLPSTEARGVDALPAEILEPLRAAIVRSLAVDDLASAFAATCEGLLREVGAIDEPRAARLAPILERLVATVR